jgi:hypothetical protein
MLKTSYVRNLIAFTVLNFPMAFIIGVMVGNIIIVNILIAIWSYFQWFVITPSLFKKILKKIRRQKYCNE